MLEPPLMEYVASLAYRMTGKERVWIPRLFSSIFWLAGGAFLYLVVRRMAPAGAALFSTGYYLFAPFGIMASRSFQPDSLMIMMLLASLYMTLLYCENRSIERFVLVSAVASLAVFIKPMCLPMVVSVFIAGTFSKRGFRAGVRDPRTWWFAFCTLAPSLAFYIYSYLTRDFFRYIADSTLSGPIYFHSFFWLGWLRMIETAVGILPFTAAVLCTLLFPRGLARWLACGLWAGYVIFNLGFSAKASTHTYYQLPLVPIVAIALAAAAVRCIEAVERWGGTSTGARRILAGALAVICAVAAVVWVGRNWEPIYYEDRDQVTIAQQIGEWTGHSGKSILLSYAIGELLEYHGELAGVPWPWRSDMHSSTGWARPQLTVEQRFQEINQAYPSDYFIVTEMDEYRAQRELGEFLVKHFPLVVRNPRYVIFDLRENRSAGRDRWPTNRTTGPRSAGIEPG